MNKIQEEAAYYAVIPAPVRYDAELSSAAKLLYCEITGLCRKKGYCWATNQHFTELLNGVSISTISRLISQLEHRGHIRTEVATIATGSERRIYVDVCYAEQAGCENSEGNAQKQQDPQGGAQTAQGGVRKNAETGVRKKRKQNDYHGSDLSEDNPPYSPPEGDGQPEETEEGDKPEPTPTPKPKTKTKGGRRDKSIPDHDPEAFEVFWAAYPRKDKRQKAVEQWDVLKPSRQLCEVMYAALSRHKRSRQWTKDDGEYIPMFSTWLHQKRWEDQGVDLSLVQAAPSSSAGGWLPDPEVTR